MQKAHQHYQQSWPIVQISAVQCVLFAILEFYVIFWNRLLPDVLVIRALCIFQETRLHQSTSSTKFTIDGHSGVLRIRPGESLDYELSRTHFVTVLAKVTQIPLFSEIDQLLCVDLSSRLLSCISEVQRTSQYQIISAVCLFQDGGGKYQGKYQVMTSTAIITINVLDTQDSPPVFVGTPYFGFVYEVSVPVSVTLFYI